jgi:natural product precursor
MKTLNKIKLNNLSAENLSNKQMKEIKGGAGVCGCSCYYAEEGGSSTSANCFANEDLPTGAGVSIYGPIIMNCIDGHEV